MTRYVRRLLASSRYFIVVAVIGSFVASAAALLYGGVATFFIVINTFRSLEFTTTGAKVLSVDLVTMIDLFLIGTVLYIVAVGLYELFIDPGLPMPGRAEDHHARRPQGAFARRGGSAPGSHLPG